MAEVGRQSEYLAACGFQELLFLRPSLEHGECRFLAGPGHLIAANTINCLTATQGVKSPLSILLFRQQVNGDFQPETAIPDPCLNRLRWLRVLWHGDK